MKIKRTKAGLVKGNAKNVGVELLEPIRRRLRLYTADRELTIKRAVNEALDEYLKKRGA